MEDRISIYEEILGPIVKWIVILILSVLTVGIFFLAYYTISESTKNKTVLGTLVYIVKLPFRVVMAYVNDIIKLPSNINRFLRILKKNVSN